jgi:hypothetical protein
LRNSKQGERRKRKSNEPVLLKLVLLIFFLELVEGLPEETKVLFKEVQGFLPESRAVSPGKRVVCSEAPSPGSSTSVKIYDVPSTISRVLKSWMCHLRY